jgi:hypothetical protein
MISIIKLTLSHSPIAKFEVVEKDGAVYIKGDEETIKAGRAKLNISCKSQGDEKVVVIGG